MTNKTCIVKKVILFKVCQELIALTRLKNVRQRKQPEYQCLNKKRMSDYHLRLTLAAKEGSIPDTSGRDSHPSMLTLIQKHTYCHIHVFIQMNSCTKRRLTHKSKTICHQYIYRSVNQMLKK